MAIQVQNQQPSLVKHLAQLLMSACGKELTETYFKLLDMSLTEALYHTYLLIDLERQRNPKPNKLNEWGMGDIEWQQM